MKSPEEGNIYKPHVTQKRISIGVVVVLIISVLAGKIFFPEKKHLTTAEIWPITNELPKTLEEYRTTLNRYAFGRNSMDYSRYFMPRAQDSIFQKAKQRIFDIAGLRHGDMGVVTGVVALMENYSAVAEKRVYLAQGRRQFEQLVTNSIYFDDSAKKTRDESILEIDTLLRTNGLFLFPLNQTSVVVLAEQDLNKLGFTITNITQFTQQ